MITSTQVFFCTHTYLYHNSHMNVEVSAQIENVKYLHKYLVKMPDRAEVAMQLADGQDMDETKTFLDGRYISTSEAVWRALRFAVHYQNPPVMRLAVHLKGEESVLFEEHGDLEEVLQRKQPTTLQAWFNSNRNDKRGEHLLYPDYVTEYPFAKGQWSYPDFFENLKITIGGGIMMMLHNWNLKLIYDNVTHLAQNDEVTQQLFWVESQI